MKTCRQIIVSREIYLSGDVSFSMKIKRFGIPHTWRIVLIEVFYGYFMLSGYPQKHRRCKCIKIQHCYMRTGEVPSMPDAVVVEVLRCQDAFDLEPRTYSKELEYSSV